MRKEVVGGLNESTTRDCVIVELYWAMERGDGTHEWDTHALLCLVAWAFLTLSLARALSRARTHAHALCGCVCRLILWA